MVGLMGKVNFNREFMFEVLDSEFSKESEIQVISNKIVDTTRWSNIYELIFKYENKYYRTEYSQGATEQQCESPWEYDGDEISCVEVKPVEKVVTVYEDV